VAELHIDGGELKSIRYSDSTDVDPPDFATNPIAPDPIFRYLWISRLLFRDANWNPNFPSSAAQLADLYARGQGVQADGVIATTKTLVYNFVDALGGVQVPALNGAVDSALAKRYVEGELDYPCTPEHSSQAPKRCFDEDLFRSIFARLMEPMPEAQRRSVFQVLLHGLERKDVLIHVFDPARANILWKEGWNGPVKQVDYDYLYVVDSSLPGHARAVVQRDIQYEVHLEKGGNIQSTLLLSYNHKGEQPDPYCQQTLALPQGCFWDYVRVYVPVQAENLLVPPIPAPEGSMLLIWGYEPIDTRSVVSAPQSGLVRLTEIGGYILVEPQTNVTIPITYTLPGSLTINLGNGLREYRLLIQRQPGMPDESANVLVQLPSEGSLVSASPAAIAQQGRWLKFAMTLDTDQLLVVRYSE